MEELARVAMICEGDAESPDKAFSGSAYGMLVHLRAQGHDVATISTKLDGVARAWAACRSYSSDRWLWRSRFRHGLTSFRARSARANRGFRRLRHQPDVILQIGPTSIPPGGGRVPYTLYCDWNFALSMKNQSSSHSSVHGMPAGEAERINQRQTAIYRDAAAIFTISERLRESFIADYGLPAERVLAVNAGPNIPMSSLVAPDRSNGTGRPTILFIGKEFERKGGDTVLRAFQAVRRQIPDARLLIAGPTQLPDAGEGVEFLGFLRKDNPAEFERLLAAYREADVFCLPSRQDPFPTVVREAMFFGLPCVTSDIWAMPEMVVDGQTGLTVPPDSPDLLADRLCRVLGDRQMARRFGVAGRARAEERYTWAAAAAAMHRRFQAIAASKKSSSVGAAVRHVQPV